jgi:plasmid stabilization system protein ParE
MDYRIEYSPEADQKADQAYEYIARSSPYQAAKWYSGLLKTIASLGRNPEHCGLAPESNTLNRPIRQLLYGKRQHKYRILFEIRGDIVYGLHIRHGARDWWQPSG